MIPRTGGPSSNHDTPRDQLESAFTAILRDLVSRIPGAQAAALVDSIGETVDYAGGLDAFTLRIAAAHWRIVLDDATAERSLEGTRWFAVRAERHIYVIQSLPDGYALLVVLARSGALLGWHRAVAACARALGDEAGWRSDARPGAVWFTVAVACDDHHRPISVCIDERTHPLEILGTLAGDAALRDEGWRVRLDTGEEATLIRESAGAWYTDEPLHVRRVQRSR